MTHRIYQFNSRSIQETSKLGRTIGQHLMSGTAIGLVGTLGTGKTTLTQSIGKSIGVADGDVVSPTFTICVPHQGRLLMLHLDAYRINSPEEVDELGLDEQLEDGAVIIVEWSDLIETYLPPLDLKIEIASTDELTRAFSLKALTTRGETLLEKLENSIGTTE